MENKIKNILFSQVGSEYIGQVITTEGVIINVDKPKPTLDIAAFECRGCMRVHEVNQSFEKKIIEPSLCSECGSKSFRFSIDESKFKDSQVITLGDENTSKHLDVLLSCDDCSYDDYAIGDILKITGRLKGIKLKDGFDYFLEVLFVEKVNSSEIIEVSEEFKKGDRNSPEYRIWQKGIIERDKVCQCCGGHKHLQAHHIFGYKNHPNYRVNLENGITLCKWCHGKYHSYYGKDANPSSLIKFIKRFGGLLNG